MGYADPECKGLIGITTVFLVGSLESSVQRETRTDESNKGWRIAI
jgi:hypothetical protein